MRRLIAAICATAGLTIAGLGMVTVGATAASASTPSTTSVPAPLVNAPASAKTVGGPLCGNIEASSGYEYLYDGTIGGIAILEYDQCTQGIWGTDGSYLSYSCDGSGPTGPGCGGNYLLRSDNASKSCDFSSYGSTYCNTPSLYDGGYTSKSQGWIWDSAQTDYYIGWTGSF